MNVPQTRISLARGGLLDIEASGDVFSSLLLDLDGAVPLETLMLAWEDMADATGTIRISSRVRSSRTGREVSGSIILEDLGWTVPENSQRIHGVSGRITIDRNRLSSDNLAGMVDSGSFRARGNVLLDGLSLASADILLEAKAIPLTVPDTMDLSMDIESSMEYGPSSARLRADVVLLEGLYYKDVKMDLLSSVIGRIFVRKQREEAWRRPPAVPGPLASIPLDITIRRKGDVKVENNMADLELNPDLKISGTIARPVVNGRITITDGTVTFQNNDFTVSHGVIDFLDPTKTRASVDITATTKVREWEITISLEGDLDDIRFTLSSEPQEDPSDIVSLLIVGRTSRELTQEQSSVAVSPTGMMAELLTSTYGGEIKKTTTLDILEFKSSQFATSTGGESMTLLVGKELSDRLTLKYEMTTRDAETIQKAVAEYKILENLLVGGYQGTNGMFGVDVFFRRKFR